MLGLLLFAGCDVHVNEGDDEPQAGDGGGQSPCAQLCATVMQVGCPGDDADRCENDCELTWDAGICTDETHAALTCYAQQDASNWACDDFFDEAEVSAGHCDAERTALESCLP